MSPVTTAAFGSEIQVARPVDPHRVTNLKDITHDFLEGDVDLYAKHLAGIDIELVKKAIDTVLSNPSLSDAQKIQLLTRSWSVVYRQKPPTIEEFLTPAYLGRTAADGNLYPRVQNVVLEFLNPQAPYRNLILAPFIGFGKSFASVIITLYMGVLISLMRDPKKFFNLGPASVLCQVLISYSLRKSSELLLEPFLNILESATYFERVHTREGMIKRDKEFEEAGENISKIFWTTAAPSSALQFSNGSNIKMISSVQNLLGLTIVTAVLSELSFFTDAGKTPEYIMRFYNDTRSRVESRMKGNWFGRTILDSSPNNLDNPIDQYIWYDAPKDPTNYIITGSRWDWAPEDFKNIDDRFPIFLGAPGVPPVMVDEKSAQKYSPTDLLWAPTELRTLFENDLIKALKDIAGRPSGDQKKLFYDTASVEKIFEPRLSNLYTHINVPSFLPPKEAIWNIVHPHFFRIGGTGFQFYYRPEIPRVFSIDQAVSNDSASISIAHTELLSTGEVLYIYDMTLVIEPLKGDINLDAIRYFIEDCSRKGGMHFLGGSFDQYQSTSARQYLERELGIEVSRLSVDLTMEPYKNFISDVKAGRVKVGRNIYIKNNLKSLIITQRKKSGTFKIDHTVGDKIDPESDSDWDKSLIGLHAKDATDSMAACAELLRRFGPSSYFHNDFHELAALSAILDSDDEYYTFLKKQQGLSTTETPLH